MLTVLLPALQIFLLRLVDVSLYTIRIMLVRRGYKALSWVFAFAQSIVFVLALQAVFSDFGDWGKVMGYSLGFATGMILGMWLEQRLAIGYLHLRVISYARGDELTARLREAGYPVTEVSALGRDGVVTLLNCGVRRRNAHIVEKLVSEIDPQAFITEEDVRPVQKGLWRP
jgi:uncharacterized protein YebE (UPF0316 family)